MLKMASSRCFKQSVICSSLIIIYFVCEGQFMAYWWPVFFLTGLPLAIFAITTFIKSVVFWIKDKGKYYHRYIPFCVTIIGILIGYSLPSAERSKQYFKATGTICKYEKGNCGCDLYAEYYCVSGSNYMSTDINSEYLTDSLNFRLFVGTYDESDQHIDVVCKGDSIIVTKTGTKFISIQQSDPAILDRKTYSLSDLQRRHMFE